MITHADKISGVQKHDKKSKRSPVQNSFSYRHENVSQNTDLSCNNTDLLGHIRYSMGNISGILLDDVKVRRNSNKPVQLNAYTCTEGRNIDIAPGQEKHLAHEAWHVDQQKQGRVNTAVQLFDKKHLNTDKNLDEEVDRVSQLVNQNMRLDYSKIQQEPVKTPQVIQQKSNVIQLFSPDILHDFLINDILKNLTLAGGRKRKETMQVFQGQDPEIRESKERSFKGMLEKASKRGDSSSQAAYVSQSIKSNQYFIDSNTRLSTAAVFKIYELNGDSLEASPLEVFAAIGEKELEDGFPYEGWLKLNEGTKKESLEEKKSWC